MRKCNEIVMSQDLTLVIYGGLSLTYIINVLLLKRYNFSLTEELVCDLYSFYY